MAEQRRKRQEVSATRWAQSSSAAPAGLRAAKSFARWSSNSACDSPGSTVWRERNPHLTAFIEEVALPMGDLGPVECWALPARASDCFGVIFCSLFVSIMAE